MIALVLVYGGKRLSYLYLKQGRRVPRHQSVQDDTVCHYDRVAG